MPKLSILVASTSQTVNVFIQDSSSTVGAGLSGLAFGTSGLTAYYALPRAAPVAITLVTQTVTGAYSSGGFVELDATHTKGLYRLDLPNAALASGRFVDVYLYGAANMAPVVLEIELTGWDNQDAIHGGLSALPNAAAAASGGLPTIGVSIPNATAGAAGGLFIAGTNATTTANITGNLTGNVSGSVGSVTGAVGSVTGNVGGSVGSVTGNVGGNVVGTVSSVTGAVGSVSGSVGSVTGAVGSVTGNVGGNVTGSVGSILGVTFPANFSVTSIDTNGNVKIQSLFKRNVALNGFQFYMALSSDHVSPATGKTITATVSLNGGAFSGCANSVAEIGSGWYQINLAATDLNGSTVALSFAAPLCDTTLLTLVTQP